MPDATTPTTLRAAYHPDTAAPIEIMIDGQTFRLAAVEAGAVVRGLNRAIAAHLKHTHPRDVETSSDLGSVFGRLAALEAGSRELDRRLRALEERGTL